MHLLVEQISGKNLETFKQIKIRLKGKRGKVHPREDVRGPQQLRGPSAAHGPCRMYIEDPLSGSR